MCLTLIQFDVGREYGMAFYLVIFAGIIVPFMAVLVGSPRPWLRSTYFGAHTLFLQNIWPTYKRSIMCRQEDTMSMKIQVYKLLGCIMGKVFRNYRHLCVKHKSMRDL